MSRHTEPWPAGTPCWADLSVPDVAAASRFYSEVLGWSVVDPGPEYGGYVIAQVDGDAAAGIGPQSDPGPVAWTLYFASEDADATAAAVTEAGGTVLLPAGDVGPLGRMFLAADPTGAVFGVWQAGVHIGAGVVNEPGGIAWEDLRTSEPDAAREFYSQVFDFAHSPMPGAPSDYMLFARADDDRPLGGMGPFMDPGAGLPPHWVVYFMVPDADAAQETALAGGGSVATPGFDSPFGRMVGLTDPFGALFWVVGQPQDAT